MSEINYKKVFAIKAKNENRIKAQCPNLLNISGIYIFHRVDENGFKKYYCGQAKNLITRLAAHFSEFDHIALSLKKHGLQCEKEGGWKIDYFYCAKSELDKKEQAMIKHWHIDKGYIPYNKTSGSQGKGKFGITENKPAKGYRDGLRQGYENARKEVAYLFEKYLAVKSNGRYADYAPLLLKAMDKFNEFLKGEKTDE